MLAADQAVESGDGSATSARQLFRDEYAARVAAAGRRLRRVHRQRLRRSDDLQRRPVLRRLSTAAHRAANSAATRRRHLHQVPPSAGQGPAQPLRADDGRSSAGGDRTDQAAEHCRRVGQTRGKS